jgi:tRNA/tmRNA/rRNA uracil-C5-methylase (TrmA/RlmC/RlmD family)
VSTRGRPRRRSGRPPRAQRRSGPRRLGHTVDGVVHRVAADGFWQVHPAIAGWLVGAVLSQLAPRPGERALDLYAGAGLFSAALAVSVGVTGAVLGLESTPDAVADAAETLAPMPWAAVRRARVGAATIAQVGEQDVVVLDPPRAGAGADVLRAVLASGARAVSYVACDPAALARDVRTALDAGWRLGELHAVDAFPMTHHVECVAQLLPATRTSRAVR